MMAAGMHSDGNDISITKVVIQVGKWNFFLDVLTMRGKVAIIDAILPDQPTVADINKLIISISKQIFSLNESK